MTYVPYEIWEEGKCRNEDTELFYPSRDATTYSSVAGQAKRICRGDGESPPCPVLLPCLLYGLITEDRFGIWGGLSPRERNALRRHRTLAKYKAAFPLQGTRYYALIENYLETREQEEDEETDEPIAEGTFSNDEE